MHNITVVKKMAALIGSAMVVISAQATTVTLTVGTSGTDVLGNLIYGNIGGSGGQAADEAADVNDVLALGLGGTTGTPGTTYVARSLNNFGALSPADPNNNPVLASGGGIGAKNNIVQIPIGNQGYTYLTARWDGPQGGAEVWYIGGLVNTTIDITEYAEPNAAGTALVDGTTDQQYQITSYTLLNPFVPPPPAVADGASTVTLLGAAITGLALIRRKTAAR